MEHERQLVEPTAATRDPGGPGDPGGTAGSGDAGGSGAPPGPERMRQAVADYVSGMHDAYVRQARALAPADQARMPLLGDAPLYVAAVGTRHLHIIGTREALGEGQRGTMAAVEGASGPLRWTLVFYDPVVVPALGLVDESEGPAFDEVRRVLGIGTQVYHLTLHPRSGLSPHHATHTGTGLANAHATAVREVEAIERAVGVEREPLVRELAGALAAGLPRAAALLARALAPADGAVATLAAAAEGGAPVDPAELRRAVLHAVRPAAVTRGDET
jgi:hypothetical protein